MMKRALTLARKGEGFVEPNPMVGCVVARGNRVMGEGFHRRFGSPHAEIEALRACVADPRGATVYVTLEPCCHTGKTPPCTEALIEAGVRRVVAAVRDPCPNVSGKGIRRLRRAGLDVQVGVMADEAAQIVKPFATYVRLHRPFVIAKWAQSLDGRLTTPRGASPWISCELSRRRVHKLRARVDAVLVGAGTVLIDNPLLTARDVRVRRRATRVVLDGRLRLRESSRLVQTADTAPTLLLTTRSATGNPKAARLARKGVEVVPCRSKDGRLSLRDCLHLLGQRDVTNLLVEGGPTVLTSFLSAGLVDEAWVFVAPVVIGSDRLRGRGANAPARGISPATHIEAQVKPRSVWTTPSGTDILYRMQMTDVR